LFANRFASAQSNPPTNLGEVVYARHHRHPRRPPPAVKTYTVVSGDTLSAISERFYGDGNRYQQIADASGVSNPDLIHPGQGLTIP
jgi:nucleoid-associated protein YgaU